MSKSILLRFLSLAVAIVLCFLCNSCKSDTQRDKNDVYSTDVKKHGFVEYGNYIYCEWGKIYRFNRKTESFTFACMDPECDGNCPMDCIMSYFAGVYEERVYFCGWQQYTHNVILAYQNIVTGEIQVLKTLSDIEDSNVYLSFIEDGYWYYTQRILKEGGDKSNPNDYEPYVCRMSLDGGREETVIKCDSSENLSMVADGKIITIQDGIIYSTEIETKNKKILYNLVENGYLNIVSRFSYYDGNIYFIAKSSLTEMSEYTQKKYNLSFLFKINLNTSDSKLVIDSPVFNFCLTEDKIYYSPFKLRHLYVPEDINENREQITTCIFDESIYTCDLNGENIRKIYTNANLDYVENYTIVDNTLYGWLYDYNDTTHTFDKTFFGGIDFDTGRIIRVEKPEA